MSLGRVQAVRAASIGALFTLAFGAARVGAAQQQPPRERPLRDSTVAHRSASQRNGASTEPLQRVISLTLVAATLDEALRAVAARGAVRLGYSSDLLPAGRRVSINRVGATVGSVLRELLVGTGLDLRVTSAGHIVIVKPLTTSLVSEGNVASAPGSTNGAPSSVVAPIAQLLSRVVVMGTPVAGAPERGFPTAITVLTGDALERHVLGGLRDAFRLSIPGVAVWDMGATGPVAQVTAIRGSSSFGVNYLKTYIDGVELASPYLLFAIDPYSVERIEVIRGPQGSALYGSDAISGVVQIVTKKGRLRDGQRPSVDAVVSGGIVQSRFVDGTSRAQDHSIALFGGGQRAAFGVGGTFDQQGPLVPGGSTRRAGAFGSAHGVVGPVQWQSVARYADVRFVAPNNPLLGAGGVSAPLARQNEPQSITHQTYGLTADHQPSGVWRQSLVVGYDRNEGALVSQRVPTSAADALLGASDERVGKASLRYSTSVALARQQALAATLTAGVEHWRMERERLGERSDVLGSGGSGLVSLYGDTVNNSGYFAQVKAALHDALFLTAGVRGERNTTFGDRYGTAWSPMVGISLIRGSGAAMVKVRGAYGKGIRPPPPSARRALATTRFRQLPNSGLSPESQEGIEAGAELYVGTSVALRGTIYHQTAHGLIQNVLADPRLAPRTLQQQNVGAIENKGVELDGAVEFSVVRAEAALAITSSRVRKLARTYAGDLLVGDRVPEVPTASGGAELSAGRSRIRAAIGATYVGSWTGYDWLSYYAATSPRPLRAYWTRYPALVKPHVVFTHQLRDDVSWFLRVDNLTNRQRNERDNTQIAAGRTTSLGMRVRHP